MMYKTFYRNHRYLSQSKKHGVVITPSGEVPSRPQKMGRKRKELVDQIRVQAWFQVVHKKTGLTAYALEKHYDGHKFHKSIDGTIVRPKQWDKYRRGAAAPRHELVAMVDHRYKGTARVLNHPLWNVAREAEPTSEDVISTLYEIHPPLAEYIKYRLHFLTAKKMRSFCLAKSIDYLWKKGGIDALTAMVCIFRIAKNSGKIDLQAEAQIAGFYILLGAITFDPLRENATTVFHYFTNLLNINSGTSRHFKDFSPDDMEELLVTTEAGIFEVWKHTNFKKFSFKDDWKKTIYWLFRMGHMTPSRCTINELPEIKRKEAIHKMANALIRVSEPPYRAENFSSNPEYSLVGL